MTDQTPRNGPCDKCKWCVARGCNQHEDHTGPYRPPPRLGEARAYREDSDE